MPIFEFRRDLSQAATPKDLLSFANQAAGQSPGAVLEVGPPTLEENPPHSQIFSFPAPTGGIKDAVLGSESSALRMRNFWPTDRGLEVRNGYQILTNFGEDNDPLALIAHERTNEVLAVYPGKIYAYNFGNGIRRLLSHAPSSSNVISSVSMRTELNVLTVLVNGVDPMVVYDGDNTVEIPRLRINTDFVLPDQFLDTRTVNVVWLYGKRMFLASRESNSAWYFDVNAVPYSGVGADDLEQVTELPLGNVFPRGGILNGGFSWSVDVGDNLNNRCVFTSNRVSLRYIVGTPM